MTSRRKVPKACTDRIRRVDLMSRSKGMSDADRHELLRFANILGLEDDEIIYACNANPEADTTLVDYRRIKP